MAGKLGKPWIALFSLALGAVYTAGYTATETPPLRQESPQPLQQELQSAPQQETVSSLPSTVQPAATTTAPAASSAAAATTTVTKPATTASPSKAAPVPEYRDGTFTGWGANNIGAVAVAVTIRNGKIVRVLITGSTTSYPETYIDPVLPREVLANQRAQVQVVSGATRSSEDFERAVAMALSKAKNPNYTVGQGQ